MPQQHPQQMPQQLSGLWSESSKLWASQKEQQALLIAKVDRALAESGSAHTPKHHEEENSPCKPIDHSLVGPIDDNHSLVGHISTLDKRINQGQAQQTQRQRPAKPLKESERPVSPRQAKARPVSPRQASPRQDRPRPVSPRQFTPRQVSPRQVSAKEVGAASGSKTERTISPAAAEQLLADALWVDSRDSVGQHSPINLQPKACNDRSRSHSAFDPEEQLNGSLSVKRKQRARKPHSSRASASPESPSLSRSDCSSSHHKLSKAVTENDPDIVKYLIEHQGYDVNGALGRHGRTPLHLACWHGHEQVVSALLELNAQTTCTGNEGKNALMWACAAGHTEVPPVLPLPVFPPMVPDPMLPASCAAASCYTAYATHCGAACCAVYLLCCLCLCYLLSACLLCCLCLCCLLCYRLCCLAYAISCASCLLCCLCLCFVLCWLPPAMLPAVPPVHDPCSAILCCLCVADLLCLACLLTQVWHVCPGCHVTFTRSSIISAAFKCC